MANHGCKRNVDGNVNAKKKDRQDGGFEKNAEHQLIYKLLDRPLVNDEVV